MTNNIEARILEHKAEIASKFTTKYKLKYLMHYEECPSIESAIEREKQLKNWKRDWKWNLIKDKNPKLNDLAADWFDEIDIRSVISGSFK